MTVQPAPTGSATATGTDYYKEFTARNAGVVDPETQNALRAATILVAGCGSIGGAAIEPLARLGARSFILADPGSYELNNLNRQNAVLSDIGRPKAQVAAERLDAIDPSIQAHVYNEGVTEDVVGDLTASCDVVVDGVDVTTSSGLRAKFLLHEHAAARRLPLVTGWDMAGAQYVRCYDYRRLQRPFDGQIVARDLKRLTSWEILQRLVPPRYVPLEMLMLVGQNLANPDFAFPQLVYAADLFGAISSHAVAELLAGRTVAEHMYFDAYQCVRPRLERWKIAVRRPLQALSLLARLKWEGASATRPRHHT